MSSRTIESVKFLDKILFYDINIETVKYHLFDRTIKTNKWLRFEDWHQLYEKLNNLLAACTSPDLSELARQTFLLPNNIQVEIEVIPMKCCYQDIFAVNAKMCAQQLIRITVRQLSVSALHDKIKALERPCKSPKKVVVNKKLSEPDKKVNTDHCHEYDPVVSKNDSKSEYVPTPSVTSYVPYKPSKFSSLEADISSITEHEEPYSPKPMTACTDDFEFEMPIELNSSIEKYSPNIISTSESTSPTTIPAYRPSTIILSDSTSCESASRLRSHVSSSKISLKKQKSNLSPPEENLESVTNTVEKDSESKRQSTTSGVESYVNYRRRKRKRLSPVPPLPDKQDKQRLSQDLFDDFEESNGETETDETYSPDDRKKKRKHSSKTYSGACKTSSSSSSKKSKESNSTKSNKSDNSSRIKISPTKIIKSDGWISKPNSKSSSSNSKTKVSKKSKSSRSKSKSSLSVEVPGSLISKETEEMLRKNKEQQEKNIEIFETVTRNLKEMNKPPVSVDIIHLNDIKVDDLIATFEEFKPTLDQHFDQYKSQKIHTVQDNLYLLILNIINRNNLMSMIDHLKWIYEPSSDGVPTYTDLFMNIMLPEWVLMIFMKEYKLTRDEAIKHIEIQVDDDICNYTLS